MPAGPRIDLASIIGRAFDTYGREWSLFLVLALPTALGSALTVALAPESMFAFPPPGANATPTWPFDASDVILFTVLSLGSGLVSSVAVLAMMFAADRLWRGEPAGVAESFGGALRALPSAIGLWLMLMLATVGLGLLILAPLALLLVLLPVIGALLAIVVVAALFVALLVFEARLSLLLPVLLFERPGIVGTVIRTWRLTHGNAIMLLVTAIAMGLIGGLASIGASMILMSTVSRPLASFATGLGTVVAAPLGAIWVVIAWGDLVGGRHLDSAVMSRGRGRLTALAILVGLGFVLFLAGSVAYTTSPPIAGY